MAVCALAGAAAAQALDANAARQQIYVRLPVPKPGAAGEVLLDPNVEVRSYLGQSPESSRRTEVLGAVEMPAAPAEPLPPPHGVAPFESLDGEVVHGIMEEGDTQSILDVFETHAGELHTPAPAWWSVGPIKRWLAWRNDPCREIGIGHERVEYAPFEIDISQPLNNFRMRFDSAYGWERPDRAEYLWSKIGGRGPKLPEQRVDYQDIRILFEMGGPKFSVGTEVPIRVLDPEINPNTAGLSDVSLTTKTVMIDGKRCQVTQIFRTYFNSGLAKRGLGSGHISMEPGVLIRYQWNPETYFHSELKYWFPIAADSDFGGTVLRYGLGVSHILYETDKTAILPTLEFVGWSVLDGLETSYPLGLPEVVDPVGILNVYPGVRFVRDNGGEMGVFELGVSAGAALTAQHWYEGIFRLDMRWSF